MDIGRFFFQLYLVDRKGNPKRFLGTAFPVVPGGGLLTCRHVVDLSLDKGETIGVFDLKGLRVTSEKVSPIFPDDKTVDMAFLPKALGKSWVDFFPILTPRKVVIGEDVYTFGYFAIGGHVGSVEQGYFGGRITNFFRLEKTETASMTLPFSVLEGMSGSPILTYHNGPKVVGIATGNRQSRILASEVLEFKDDKSELRETVNRIVEFGVAHHCAAIALFLQEIGAPGFVVSEERVALPGLTD